MAFDELKQDLMEANADIKSYLEYSEEYLKLRVFKLLMVSFTSFSRVLVIGGVSILALLFLSIAASVALGSALQNTTYGFLLVGVFYVFLSVILFLFRDRLDRPVLKKFSKHFFDNP